MSDMPDSNRNWKGRYFFVQGTDWVCHREEWVTMPHGFDNTWGIVKDSSLVSSTFSLFLYLFVKVFNVICFFSFSTSVCLCITNEQEAFIRRVLEIPFDKRKCRDLITLDTLHAYCGGDVPTLVARRLNTYSCRISS